MSCENVPAPTGTPGIARLMDQYSETEDTRDDNLSWFFAAAHCLWHLTATDIPPQWGYNHPAFDDGERWDKEDDWRVAQITQLYSDGLITEDDMIDFGQYCHEVDLDFKANGDDW